MKELLEAIEQLGESQARVEHHVFRQVALKTREPEQATFFADLSEAFGRRIDYLAGNAAASDLGLSEMRWPTSETGCKYASRFFNLLRWARIDKGEPATPQVFGQVYCQMEIRLAAARRVNRELEYLAVGVRKPRFYWENEVPANAKYDV